MPKKISWRSRRELLIFLLTFGLLWELCDFQVTREEANKPPDGQGGDDGAFFALRSCHQFLQGDTGEFFSPDYLCSNPPLWCNWTIQVDPAMRIHLHLEDLTPDDACHLKEDQVHVDEPAGHFGGHRVLQKCWREAKYTSSSNTLYVVLLIGGWPSPPYRGFYGRYQAFGPPVVYNPQEGFTDRKPEPAPGLVDFSELVMNERMESEPHSPANSDLMYDYYGRSPVRTSEGPWEPEEAAETDPEPDPEPDPEVGENHQENLSHVSPSTAEPTVPTSTQGTSRSGRGAAQTTSVQSDGQNQELKPTSSSSTTTQTTEEDEPTRPEEAAAPHPEEEGRSADGAVGDLSDQLPAPSEAAEPEPEQPEPTHPHPNMVEPLSDHRGNLDIRNHSETSHLPGDHLFEVAVEVNFHRDVKKSWDDQARTLLLAVKTLISKNLEALHTPLSVTSKRLKRLSTGVLYILWLQIGQGPGGLQVHRAVHAALQDLIEAGLTENHEKGVVLSVSTADVNECGSQLVLCDVNADCVNQFGSYSCRCRPGFRDESAGGIVCVDLKAAGCSSSGISAETKGVYVLFFLLSSLILMLLAAAGLLYHRHHRGAFLVRCHSGDSFSPSDPNNNNHHHHHHHDDSDLPPPPPPARGFREGWPQVKQLCPAVDLPLLRFSPLLQPDAYREPQEGGKL
ncbi:uncharacterized protein zgc:66455 isoform X3 [Centropristis striata]|uniref:uncharacterized protein zgc:66455 isoform X3 n=1 Tax=Centropristis striata TaxID=184440 RepID=UPI0027E03A0E|nr:uncharacterized protein zgc:66455 isoform X3 [Centropristis striata]